MLTLNHDEDEGEFDEGHVHQFELVKTSEDVPVALKSLEQPFGLGWPLVDDPFKFTFGLPA